MVTNYWCTLGSLTLMYGANSEVTGVARHEHQGETSSAAACHVFELT